MTPDHAEQVWVVTGVTSGIGRRLVDRLTARGSTVVGLGRGAEAMAAVAEQTGLHPVVVDLSDPEAVARAGRGVAEGFGRIDVLVHNAARCVYDTPLEHSDEGWRALLQVNALAAASLTRALAPCLPDRTGQLVALGSVVSEHLPNTRFAPYAVSKAALDAWVAAVRLELAPRGVRTLLLRLGLVDTPIYEKVTGFERTLQRIRDSPSEWLTPDDVVEALLWATDQPAHVAVSELTLLPRGQAR